MELLQWWRREGREHQLFFAQLEAAETVIFMREARGDFLQGINVPVEEVSEAQRGEGIAAFLRYACKMATGSGKTTVMGMLAAWSILNKVNSRGDARFSDVVLVVCPNVTIRNRLAELDPEHGEASLYRTRDLVPSHLMPLLTRGRVLTTNWHTFELQSVQTGGVTSKVSKAGKPIQTRERILIASKTTTARGKRYMTLEALTAQVNGGWVRIIEEEREEDGSLRAVKVESTQYVESDTHFIDRVMGREVGGKQNILVFNDEAHHAYRIKPEKKDDEGEGDLFGEDEDSDDFFKEATVWVEGLDRIHKHRGINFCVDLSATPYFLGRVGQDTNRPFPWVVSDFGLTDAIEAGLVKIPQLAVRDTTGAEIPGYFNIWRWMMEEKLTPAEKGGKKGTPKPEAVLKYAHHPIAILGGLWEEMRKEWAGGDDPRPPVFILVCKNTKIAKVIYEWLGEDKQPTGIPPAKIEGFRNRATAAYTIRVDSKVVNETDSGQAKQDESKWMRVTLDTVGKTRWPTDRQGVPIYPEGFEELARKLGKPLHPPGRDVRCIVSVGMLTEGWDCNTVTHIIGLRPFMSQLLCEQVVGRGLRRTNYKDFDEQGRLREEVAKVFGVPFEVIPYKQNPTSGPVTPSKRHHIHAIPEKAKFEIKFPRVEGYTQAIRNRIHVNWESVPKLTIEPDKIPTEVEVMGLSVTNEGRMSLTGKNKIEKATLEAFRAQRRIQEIEFDLATGLTNFYLSKRRDEIPAQKLFPQLLSVVRRYVDEKLEVRRPGDKKDAGLSPYYGWLVERLVEAIRPDTSRGESPEVPRYEQNRGAGSTEDVDFWSSKDVREVNRSHLNFVVADTKKWEQAAAYLIDTHPAVDAFVKNQGLGFAIPYLHNGQMHDYVPDFIIRLRDGNPPMQVILETKGFDPLEEIKKQAAERWVAAVNADGTYGRWAYRLVKHPSDILKCLDEIGSGLTPGD
ncbi:DEAD/DEAH box helicase family protein [Candidatus Sumerlaeota bacterium]|nr:DEAD/DEAH box helicase family protein [Candidatus Sumerlaeota bacterium]